MLRKGQVVKIYEDPVTMKKLEGAARLVKFISMAGLGIEMWQVRFTEDGYEATRLIKQEDDK